jgi:hypothetical protein
MTVLVSDSFNRADSTNIVGTTDSFNGGSSKTWNTVTGTWGVNGNQLYISSATSDDYIYVDSGVSDNYSVQVDISRVTNSEQWLVFRFADKNNFLMFGFPGTGAARLYRRVAGTFTSMITTSLTPIAGTIYTLKVQVSGSTITLYNGGTQIGTVTYTGLTTNTGVGLRNGNATITGVRYDNFQVEDLNTGGTFTDGSTAFDLKQSIYQDNSLAFDTKQTIYNDSFISSDTKQVIYSDSSISFDTLQQIQLGGVDGSVTFDTKQTLYSDSSVQFDTKQGVYSDSQALFNTKQTYYNDGFVSFDTLQVIEKIDWVDGSVSFDTQQLIAETPKVVAQEVNLTFIAENEVNLSSEIENSVSLSFTI